MNRLSLLFPAGGSPVPNNVCRYYEWLAHRNRRPPFERWRPPAVLQWQQPYNLHEGRSGQARLPLRGVFLFLFFFSSLVIYFWFNWLLITGTILTFQVSHHRWQQDLCFWEGEWPHGPTLALCWQTAAIHGWGWRSYFCRGNLCRDWGNRIYGG